MSTPEPRPILALHARPYQITALREVLTRVAREDPRAFDVLFTPGIRREPVTLGPELAFVLRKLGLVAGERAVVGRLPIRRRGDRFYVMALGGIGEYRQDIWPETDAMLAILDDAAPGRLLDMGTGCGIVAIEGAVRGHAVIATDLYENTLRLARFNAALNGVADRIEFRRGHLFEPVRGERFDLALTAPHYTKVADQLRLEALRAAPEVVSQGGRIVVATFLEWEGEGPPAMAETVFADHVRRGFDVTVTPMRAAVKQAWFTVAVPDEPIAGLVSRHRFLVEITRASDRARLEVERPGEDAIVHQAYTPLRRITLGDGAGTPTPARRLPVLAVVDAPPDLDRLEQLIAASRSGVVSLDGSIPSGLLDACRFGARPCVPPDVIDGAAGAILDPGGGIRPCTHGRTVASVEDTFAELLRRLTAEAESAAARRGCATCAARPMCSRCLFPHVVDEARYCDLIRTWADALPGMHRLLAVLGALGRPAPPLRVKLHRAAPLVAARGRPPASTSVAPPPFQAAVAALASRWRELAVVVAIDGEHRTSLFWFEGTQVRGVRVARLVAEIGELIGDGQTAAELALYLRAEQHPIRALAPVLDTLHRLLVPLRTPHA